MDIDTSISAPVTAPYSLQATVRLLQRRPTNRVDRWESGGYHRAVPTARGPRLLHLANHGTIHHPDLRLQVLGGDIPPETLDELVATVRRMLGLDAPPAPETALAEREPRLTPVLTALAGFRTPCFPRRMSWGKSLPAVMPTSRRSSRSRRRGRSNPDAA